MTFKILHHFVSDEGVLREIKWLDVAEDAPKSNLYQWQWLPFGHANVDLTFKSSAGSTRVFEEGSLVFNHTKGTFTFYDDTFILKKVK